MPLGSKGKKPTVAEKTVEMSARLIQPLQTPLHDTKSFSTPQKTGTSAFALADEYIKEARQLIEEDFVQCPARRSSLNASPAAPTKQWLRNADRCRWQQILLCDLQAELVIDRQICMTTELTNLPCGTVQIRV